MPNYTDQEVVAALNSCLDLTKWAALPSTVRERIEGLIRHNRVRAVCFMGTEGFGLRVYDAPRTWRSTPAGTRLD